ncbi:MAG: ergothioneine biosynthesis protein EgtB [Tistlia sp.]|uniref:ergothioneine biosynthesis protein EgtB n=1 Tax=Tistlia sp. TaxID=3057121 RepID=UPI0034A25ABE
MARASSRPLFAETLAPDRLAALYRATRQRTLALIEGLAPEDMTVQSMEDASPTKWHLAHTSWFFEEFVLRPHLAGYASPDERFAFLFNSYYVAAGPRFARDRRGLVTRPTVAEVLDYRAGVDAAMARLLDSGEAPADLIELGCHHEMQHQELLLTDLLHVLSHNPLLPVYRAPTPLASVEAAPAGWQRFEGGIVEIGHGGDSFAYDCEGPRHQALLRPYELATRAVTCGEWLEFMADGGYETPGLWLMDGFATARREGWEAPGYWWRDEGGGAGDGSGDGGWMTFSLRGPQPVDPQAPVSHVSYYEAEAFARWAGARLPSEFEWERAAGPVQPGNTLESGALRPRRALAGSGAGSGDGLLQLWGDVWEWTGSSYLPYPGFRAPEGAVGEYNGKFMVNQFVLRGGSALTPRDQLRPTYRNFFYPHQRWQMTGLRLARDA